LRKHAKRKKKARWHLSYQALITIVAGVLLALVPMIVAHSGYRGEVLIASMRVGAPFDKSLIFISRHGLDGAEGIILNKPLPIADRIKLSAFLRDTNIPVGYGGPIELYDRILVLKERKRIDAEPPRYEISDWDTAVRREPDLLDRIRNSFKSGDQRYRVFTGYASWSPLQLESETLVKNQWFVVPANHDIVFQNGADTKWEALKPEEGAGRRPHADQS
jgi:putative transcriptional regulator